MRQAVSDPGERGYWVGECPSLPGCITQGKTKEEAVANIREAIEACIEALEEDGLAAPLVRGIGIWGGWADDRRAGAVSGGFHGQEDWGHPVAEAV